MAEAWADAPPEGPENLVDDPNQAIEDANRDVIIEDGTKPKRLRTPASISNDDTLDDMITDEIPKPKRGRGRPKKDEEIGREQQCVTAMRRELDELRSTNTKLSEKLAHCMSEKIEIEQDLELTRSSLSERDQDYADLLDQFSSHEEKNTLDDTARPNGLVVFDEITEPIVERLKKSINWTKVKKGLLDLNELDSLKNSDVVLIISGAKEIASGLSAFHLHQSLKKLLTDIGVHTLVYVTNIPPNNHT